MTSNIIATDEPQDEVDYDSLIPAKYRDIDDNVTFEKFRKRDDWD